MQGIVILSGRPIGRSMRVSGLVVLLFTLIDENQLLDFFTLLNDTINPYDGIWLIGKHFNSNCCKI